VRKSDDGENKKKSDWQIYSSKPGVDISEFYNPSQHNDEDKSYSRGNIVIEHDGKPKVYL